ncbi:MAG TPA: hypothetical protein VFT68_18640 [Lapillicoccus sp.]|nr:hypothetical protein [Lapillicoccus sp.]
MKPSPLSAVLADDLLLDRVGARLDADDDLGALLLAVAHQADTPIPRAVPTRRRRGHRGLTVLAALGVAVSGATVAAAVELAPMPADAASGAPHTRTFLPPSLQALVMPFLAGTPFQGRLVMPFGSLPMAPVGATTAAGLPGATLPGDALALPSSSATPSTDAEQGNQEQQDLSRQKTQAKGTQTGSAQTGGQGSPTGSGTTTEPGDGDDQGEQPQTAPTTKPTKPTPTPTPTTPTIPTTPTANPGNGAANGAGSGNGAANGNGSTNGTGHGRTTTGTTTGTTDGTDDDTGDDPVSGGPAKHGAPMRLTTGSTTSGLATTGTPPSKARTAGGTAPTTSAPSPTETVGSSGTVAADDGTVTS